METNTTGIRALLAALAVVTSLASPAFAQEPPSAAEMWAIIQQQQQEIAALKARLEANETALGQASEAIEQTSEQIEATASYVETMAPAASAGASGPQLPRQTSLGGYGELHYNFGKDDRADFHRWVLFVDHAFSERVRFASEIELEHSIAGEGKTGEIELEQAYVEFELNETDFLKAGLFLVPVGILNETHEPTTFYGVERNRVESAIIPTTWWEGGLGYSKRIDSGWAFDAALHTGLKVPTSGSSAFSIRSGRQKVGNAEASNGAVTGRATYSGLPGVQLGLSAQYQSDLAQGMFSETIGATLVSAHADIQRGPFGLRTLYAQWNLDGDAPSLAGSDTQRGWYIEPSYRLPTEVGDFGFFARYSAYDTKAGSAADTEDAFFDIGMNYWPIENVVFKWDIQFTNFANSSKDEEIINLGIGYHF